MYQRQAGRLGDGELHRPRRRMVPHDRGIGLRVPQLDGLVAVDRKATR
jgi:hypothetical protein